MTPAEREAYLKEWDETEKSEAAKKNGLIEKLIARGNKRTEEQLMQEQREREALRARSGAGAGTATGAGAPIPGAHGARADTDTVIR
jgi:hypothetical protein